MRQKKTAYELSRSQVATPEQVVSFFWDKLADFRDKFESVIDFGAGDGRFSVGDKFNSYLGIEIDKTRCSSTQLSDRACIQFGCAFEHVEGEYSACIGNPPYVRHHDLEKKWRDRVAVKFSVLTGTELNRKCNLFVYFMILGLLKTRADGLVALVVPYEWVSRPSAKPLRDYITRNRWDVHVYRFEESIFDNVLTTASLSIIDKRSKNGKWNYYKIGKGNLVRKTSNSTGSNRAILPYENRGAVWAKRGMSPGTQKVFTLTEGERIHEGLELTDVYPCVTSLRDIPRSIVQLTKSAFRSRFVNEGKKCWLIASNVSEPNISSRLRRYLDSIPIERRDTWTCNTRDVWYKYDLFHSPNMLLSTAFVSHGPKVVINSVGAYCLGSVCGIYSNDNLSWRSLRDYISEINFEKQVISHANNLKKVEIRQLNSILNTYAKKAVCYE